MRTQIFICYVVQVALYKFVRTQIFICYVLQVALYKFVRMAGDLLPAALYVPYINMLTGLASTCKSAEHCYNLLKMNGENCN